MAEKVVVTTKHRGVFFGEIESRDGEEITLLNARVCVYWSRAVKGFVGLAKGGPDSDCKVSPAAPKLELFDVTSVVHCSEEAVKAWEAEPWS